MNAAYHCSQVVSGVASAQTKPIGERVNFILMVSAVLSLPLHKAIVLTNCGLCTKTTSYTLMLGILGLATSTDMETWYLSVHKYLRWYLSCPH